MSVSLDNYEVQILPQWGNVHNRESNYVVMPGNDCKYSIFLKNRANTNCDAAVTELLESDLTEP